MWLTKGPSIDFFRCYLRPISIIIIHLKYPGIYTNQVEMNVMSDFRVYIINEDLCLLKYWIINTTFIPH